MILSGAAAVRIRRTISCTNDSSIPMSETPWPVMKTVTPAAECNRAVKQGGVETGERENPEKTFGNTGRNRRGCSGSPKIFFQPENLSSCPLFRNPLTNQGKQSFLDACFP